MRKGRLERPVLGAIGLLAGLALLACDGPTGPLEVAGGYRLE